MKTFKLLFIALAIFTGTFKLSAQDQIEALKFAQQFPQSDARSLGAGNAFGAVGANLISTSINPGSLALYKKSEFSFSLGFLNIKSDGTYLGESSTDHRYALNLPQIGMAVTKINTKSNGEEVKDGWVNYTFAASINRTNSFQANKYFQGTNTQSSVLYNYAENPNSMLGDMAWNSYLIDTIANDPFHNTYIPIDTNTTKRNYFQQNSVRTKGSSYDINLALAGNYSDKLYIGCAISFPTLNYNETLEFSEINNHRPSTYLSSDYARELKVNGTGVKASFGVIMKPIKYIRVGGSVQSPTYYSLHGTFTQTMNAARSDGNFNTVLDGENDFNYVSPFKATGSLAVIAGKYGFVSFDYEFIDYSQAYFSSSSSTYTAENNRIKSYYNSTSNIRLGGEAKLDNFAFRAGYGIFGSPYKNGLVPNDADGSSTALSFGIGYRESNMFIDFGYQQIKTKEFYLPYSLGTETMKKYNVSQVTGNTYNITQSTFLVTMGVKF